jgi:hypothetical protein
MKIINSPLHDDFLRLKVQVLKMQETSELHITDKRGKTVYVHDNNFS